MAGSRWYLQVQSIGFDSLSCKLRLRMINTFAVTIQISDLIEDYMTHPTVMTIKERYTVLSGEEKNTELPWMTMCM